LQISIPVRINYFVVIILYVIIGTCVNFIIGVIFAITQTSYSESSLHTRLSHDSPPCWYYFENIQTGLTRMQRVQIITKNETTAFNFDSINEITLHPSIPLWSCMQYRPDQQDEIRMGDTATGWPFLSFHASYDEPEFTSDGFNYKIYGGIAMKQDILYHQSNIFPKIIPFYPIWRGLLYNALFYAVIVYGLRWIILAKSRYRM